MFFGIDLNQIFTFPFKEAENRKNFFIGCAVALSAFIVPILPYLALFGYSARIAKQIFNNESLRMPAWDNWEEILKDGARMFGVRMIYSLPILIFAIPIMIAGMALPIIMENVNSSEAESVIVIFSIVMLAFFCLIIPISMPLAVILPAAEMYAVDKSEFAAGFRIREWWAIFRANLSGFIAAFAIYYLATMVLVIALQIIMATIILSCLLPILMPAMTFYLPLIMYTTIAQAYKVGKDKLAQTQITQTAE